MTMSDRIAVFNQGRIEQLGTPEEVYERPRTSFVADFIGSANVFVARVLAADARAVRLLLEDEVEVALPRRGGLPVPVGGRLYVAVRPERVKVRYEDDLSRNGCVRLKASLVDNVWMGDSSQIFLLPFAKPKKVLLALSMDPAHRGRKPAMAWADIEPEDLMILEPADGREPADDSPDALPLVY